MVVSDASDKMQVRPVRGLLFALLWRTTTMGSIYGLLLGGVFGGVIGVLYASVGDLLYDRDISDASALTRNASMLIAVLKSALPVYPIGMLLGAVLDLILGLTFGILDGVLLFVITLFAIHEATNRNIYQRIVVLTSVAAIGTLDLFLIYASRSQGLDVTTWLTFLCPHVVIVTLAFWRINYLIAKWFSDPQGWERRFSL